MSLSTLLSQTAGTCLNPSLSDAIFPLGRGLQSWTTLQSASDALPISDETFRPTRCIKALSRDTVISPEPDSRPAMLAVFPKGSCSLSNTNGGFSFYSPGPENVDLTTAKEVTFGYSVMFEEGFQFNMGGKLPGLCEYSFCLFVIGTHKAQDGGDNEEVAAACSGGRHNEGGWSVRLMWRTGGARRDVHLSSEKLLSGSSSVLCTTFLYVQFYLRDIRRARLILLSVRRLDKRCAADASQRCGTRKRRAGSHREWPEQDKRLWSCAPFERSWPHPWHADTDVLRRFVFIAVCRR